MRNANALRPRPPCIEPMNAKTGARVVTRLTYPWWPHRAFTLHVTPLAAAQGDATLIGRGHAPDGIMPR